MSVTISVFVGYLLLLAGLALPRRHAAPASTGDPRWALDLFRSRRSRPGQWVATYERAADRLHLTAAAGDRAVDAGDGAARERAAG